MFIRTYNTRTLNGDSLGLLSIEIENIQWDVIGLCETKIPGTQGEGLNWHQLCESISGNVQN